MLEKLLRLWIRHSQNKIDANELTADSSGRDKWQKLDVPTFLEKKCFLVETKLKCYFCMVALGKKMEAVMVAL